MRLQSDTEDKGLAEMMFSNKPMNTQQLEALRRRIGTTEDSLAASPMPTDIGSGLQRLGSAVGLAAMRARYNSQFPDGPPMPSGGYAPQAKPPIQSILETVSGNRMPWQFPAAPSVPGATASVNPPSDSTGWNLPMTSPRQGDRQQPPVATVASAPASVMQPNSPIASMQPGGLFGLGNILNPNTGGLW
jgi:hypothetical protein